MGNCVAVAHAEDVECSACGASWLDMAEIDRQGWELPVAGAGGAGADGGGGAAAGGSAATPAASPTRGPTCRACVGARAAERRRFEAERRHYRGIKEALFPRVASAPSLRRIDSREEWAAGASFTEGWAPPPHLAHLARALEAALPGGGEGGGGKDGSPPRAKGALAELDALARAADEVELRGEGSPHAAVGGKALAAC